MRSFAIRLDDEMAARPIGYLFYCESKKKFYIELSQYADLWELPVLLAGFLQMGSHTIGSYWSRKWIQERIVPPDRQNLAHILKENKLKEYDEFKLLMLAQGRCAQDDFYLQEIDRDEVSKEVKKRWQHHIKDILPSKDNRIWVFFQNGKTKLCDIKATFGDWKRLLPILSDESLFRQAEVQPGGFGICWGEGDLEISYHDLYRWGKPMPVSLDMMLDFAKYRFLDTAETMRVMECSRQYISQMVEKNKLEPVLKKNGGNIFLKTDVFQLRKN